MPECPPADIDPGHDDTALRARLAAIERENGRLRQAIRHGHHIRGQSLQVLDKALDELATQNLRFEAALDNMTQGLCMLDAERHLAVLNRRFADMFGIEATAAYINSPPERLVQAVMQAGTVNQSTGEALLLFTQSIDDDTATLCCELTDGRTVTASRRAIEGGGWVATFEDITERRRTEARLDYMALHDALTDLPNRVLLRAQLGQQIANTLGGGLAVLYIDLDRFKDVNDTLGHPVGDTLLQVVAERLKGCVRKNDVVARLGGDEFAVVQLQADQPAQARVLARRLVEVIGASYRLDGNLISVGASIGVALAPADGTTADTILKAADLALCRAKAEGRGTYRFFETAMNDQLQARRKLETDLRDAVSRGDFELYFQPLVEVATGRVACFEALLRWRHRARGLVLPSEFVPLAEETGLIIPIGDWVLLAACNEAVNWPDHINIAVNLSVIQFRNPRLVEVVRTALSSSGLAPSRLELEITESVLIHDPQAKLATLNRLRDLGVAIAMDDFGTGYSSLSYLSKFPFDKIKIDQSFIGEMATKSQALAIIRSVVHLGRALGIPVIAEGVETEEQLRRLRQEGCTQAQGYLFSHPCPAESIDRLIKRLLVDHYTQAEQPLPAFAQ